MAVISSDSKIPLKDIVYIVAFTWFLAGMKSEIKELRLKIDGKLDLYEYRLAQVENKIPGHKATATVPPAAITSRALSGIRDFKDGEDE